MELDDDLAFHVLNFQPEEPLARLVQFLRRSEPSRLLLLSGPEGIGRRYAIKAALHRLRNEGKQWHLVDLDLDGFECDRGAGEDFVLHCLRKRYPDQHEQARLAAALRPLLEIIGMAIPGATFVSTLLGLERPVTEILGLLQRVPRSLPNLPPRERIDRLLNGLFDALADNAGVVILVRTPHALADPLKRLLFQMSDVRPEVVVAFAIRPEDDTSKVAAGASREPMRLEIRAATLPDVSSALARALPSHRFPTELADALWRITRGIPHDLGARLADLMECGAVYADEDGVWRLADDDVEVGPLVRVFGFPFYDPVDRLLRGIAPHEVQTLVRQFLAAAVVCGDNVPADAVLAALGVARVDQEEVIEFVDSRLVGTDDDALPTDDSKSVPVFRDLGYTHPGFPRHMTYAFTNPLFRLALRERLGWSEWQSVAGKLSRQLQRCLPVDSRAAAEVHLSVASFIDDAAARTRCLQNLAWWVSLDDCDSLVDMIVQQLESRELAPDTLWLAIGNAEGRWPAYRLWALLEAYGVQPGGMPLARLGPYLLKCSDTLLAYGKYAVGARYAMRAIHLYRSSSDEEAVGRALRSLSNHLRYMGKYHVSLSVATQALAIAEKHLGPNSTGVADGLDTIGYVLRRLGRHAEAIAAHERALRIWETGVGQDSYGASHSKTGIGLVLLELKDYGNAKVALDEALSIGERWLGPDHRVVAIGLFNLGGALVGLGDHVEARRAYERAIAIWEKTCGPDYPDIYWALTSLAGTLTALGDTAQAASARERAEQLRPKKSPVARPRWRPRHSPFANH